MQDRRPYFLRGLIIDVYPYSATDEQIINAERELDLVPSSLEGVKIEREQSNARMKSVKPLAEPIAALSVFAAEAVTQYMLDQIKDPDAPKDHIREVMLVQNAQVIGVGVQSIIAQLLETGDLELKKE